MRSSSGAKDAQFNISLEQRPRIHATPGKAPALKARFTFRTNSRNPGAMPQASDDAAPLALNAKLKHRAVVRAE
ncbi:MAG: hypothetical protein DME61_08450 [Verrucomicrobia bacterium]|nr:MAG: hypothetical protein DME61_08450 [Verrucomicrobiota bacterium]